MKIWFQSEIVTENKHMPHDKSLEGLKHPHGTIHRGGREHRCSTCYKLTDLRYIDPGPGFCCFKCWMTLPPCKHRGCWYPAVHNGECRDCWLGDTDEELRRLREERLNDTGRRFSPLSECQSGPRIGIRRLHADTVKAEKKFIKKLREDPQYEEKIGVRRIDSKEWQNDRSIRQE